MVEATKGHSRIIANRRWDDYASLKQAHKGHDIKEVIISGWGTTAAAEFEFASEDTDYVGTAAQACIRTEADDANQRSKYVYLEYQDNTGAITVATADLDASNTTTEVNIGSTDCYRVRRMISEVESATGGGKMITLTDANMGGNDNWAYIEDGNSQFIMQRFFVQPSATCASYLGRIIAKVPTMAAAATAIDAVKLVVAYTPKILSVNDGFAEPQIKTNITAELQFNGELNWQPCIELEPATEVTFTWSHTTTGQIVWFEAIMFEAYL